MFVIKFQRADIFDFSIPIGNFGEILQVDAGKVGTNKIKKRFEI